MNIEKINDLNLKVGDIVEQNENGRGPNEDPVVLIVKITIRKEYNLIEIRHKHIRNNTYGTMSISKIKPASYSFKRINETQSQRLLRKNGRVV